MLLEGGRDRPHDSLARARIGFAPARGSNTTGFKSGEEPLSPEGGGEPPSSCSSGSCGSGLAAAAEASSGLVAALAMAGAGAAVAIYRPATSYLQ